MKKILLILILTVHTFSNAQIVNIPDTNFKDALLNANINFIAYGQIVDTNNDNEIQYTEAEAIQQLLIFNEFEIENLTGIEAFINITSLQTSGQINSLDLSNNTNLIELHCNNNLNSLILGNNPNLNSLHCNHNELTTLNLSGCPNLTELFCRDNQLTTLVLNNNLEILWCNDNQLNNLDITNNINLQELWCSGNQLNVLDTSNNINLTLLWCSSNQIDSFDLTNNPLLENLSIHNNLLSNLDVGSNVNLDFLRCNSNQLSTLDLSNNNNLIRLMCADNPNLTYINLKNGNNEYMHYNEFEFQNLPNLETVCVDELNTNITSSIQSQTSQYIIFTTDCQLLNTFNNTLLNFSVYPIPTTNILTIKSKTEIIKIKIYNNLGQLVLLNTNQNTINISNLSKGLFLVKIEDLNGNFGVKKVIKE